MQDKVRKHLTAIGSCLLAGLLAGCCACHLRGKPEDSGHGGWGCCGLGRHDEAYANTPAGRVDELRGLAKQAPKLGAEEQERLSEAMAGAIAVELDPLVRAQSVRTLAHFQTAKAAAVLAASLQDADPDVRIAGCEAWGWHKGPDAAGRLSETLASDSDFDVRLAAARALGELKNSAAVEGLALALEDPDPAMQHRAVQSLEQVTGRYYGNDVAAWRQYAQGAPPPERPLPVAERWRRLF